MEKKGSFILFILMLNIAVFASHELDPNEVLSIISTLSNRPSDCWITHGYLKGYHSEYSSADNNIIESTEFIQVEGDKFYWEINFLADQTIDDLSKEAATNLQHNAKRVFTWDGQRYSMYFSSSNKAIVTENTSQVPINVNGILTAGIIPWGYGIYSYENLAKSKLSAIENYKGRIILKIKNTYDIEVELDPEKNYAVVEHKLMMQQGAKVITNYSNFLLIDNAFIPQNINQEKFLKEELISKDQWQITEIDTTNPKPVAFVPPFKNNDFIEFYPSRSNRQFSYNYSNTINTELLLQKKLVMTSSTNLSDNCATYAIKQVLSAFKKNNCTQSISKIINSNGQTSLYDMEQYFSDSGLYCSAISTDLDTLETRSNCQIILYLPESSHYVIVEKLNHKYAWLIDFGSDKFYYRILRRDLDGLWTNIALIVSDELSKLPYSAKISDKQAQAILGSDGGGIPNYSCDELILEAKTILCPERIGGLCYGRYWEWIDRYGCIEDEKGGICTGTNKVGKIYTSCCNIPSNPEMCTSLGNWIELEIRACDY